MTREEAKLDEYYSEDKMTHLIMLGNAHQYYVGQFVRAYFDKENGWWVTHFGDHGWERGAPEECIKIPKTMRDYKELFRREKEKAQKGNFVEHVRKWGEPQFGLYDSDGLVEGSRGYGFPKRKEINELIEQAKELGLNDYKVFVESNLYIWDSWQDYFAGFEYREPTDLWAEIEILV